MSYLGISLFASGGIGDLAMRSAGVDVILANELLVDRADLLGANFPNCEVLVGDIWSLRSEIVTKTKEILNGRNLDVILATPPCQGMSKNGRGKLLNLVRSGLRPDLDARNQLILPTLDIVCDLMPSVVVFENVPEMKDTIIQVGTSYVGILEHIENTLCPLGYKGKAEVVEFADYGVPQRRQRLITIYTKNETIIEVSSNLKSYLPPRTHCSNPPKRSALKKWITLRDIISDLPKLDGINEVESKSEIPYHRVPVLDTTKYYWISNTPPESGAFDNQCSYCQSNRNVTHGSLKNGKGINRASTTTPIYCVDCGELLPRPWVKHEDGYRIMNGFTSAYRRMKWDLPATALTTNLSYPSSDSKLHPDQNRVLSLYEAFIVHTISDFEYRWVLKSGRKASDKTVREVIGESIPPRGLKIIFSHLLSLYIKDTAYISRLTDKKRRDAEKNYSLFS